MPRRSVLHRAFAALAVMGFLVAVLAQSVSAQINPPVPAPTGPVNPAIPAAATPFATPSPTAESSPAAEASPEASPVAGESPTPAAGEPGAPAPGQSATPAAGESATPAPGETAPGEASPSPSPTPTQPPIVVTPATPSIEPGRTVLARVNSAAGTLTVTVADPSIATVAVDQVARTIAITGVAVGSTIVTVGDSRGLTRDVAVRVAYDAGTIAPALALHVTGNPASVDFLRNTAIDAAEAAATLRPGARIYVPADAVTVRAPLPSDNHISIDVPVQILGDAYITASGTTHIAFENDALPKLAPSQLLVSDYPERLTADGVLFTATIDRTASQRFLYYHFNPGTEPPRRILVKATNNAATPAVVHVIAALAGPGANEMEVGHNATRSFLVRSRRNEGTIVTIPPRATVNIVNHNLPPNSVVNGIMQLRELSGDPLNIAVVAQQADAPLDQSADAANLLAGGAPHARGVYPVPEFFSDYTFFTDAPPLEIPIGQLPLPNLREGEALSGDYGVMQSVHVVIVNPSRFGQAIALYANPRGGDATGTFIIDDTIVQAHRLTAFSRYKIWQETIAPGTYRSLRITTMPEGGSSYPLRLVFAQDDGSVAPGAPGSPVY
jgi:Pilus formation protein N terminal region